MGHRAQGLVLDGYIGAMLGVAVGDALGATLEFQVRDAWPPVEGLVGGGPHMLRPGEWTDDTAMTLCSAYSLCAMRGFCPVDHMERFRAWHQQGWLSCKGYCFDIGDTTARAMQRYYRTGNAYAGSTAEDAQGNGSLMRAVPPALYAWGLPAARAAAVVRDSSRLTHAHPMVLNACVLYSRVLWRLLAGDSPQLAATAHGHTGRGSALQGIAAAGYATKGRRQIRSTGYVVDTLEAALWCLWHTESFEEAVLLAANLGGDADTVAAVCGGLAGAAYGAGGIPPRLLATLDCRTLVASYGRALYAVNREAVGNGQHVA